MQFASTTWQPPLDERGCAVAVPQELRFIARIGWWAML
jgi:hypothetical protein